jgi:hypothetical protein
MSRRSLAVARLCALTFAVLAAVHMRPAEARHGLLDAPRAPAYLLVDATTERLLSASWDEPDRPVPVGSLIKPFTALAYAGAHRFIYPTYVCRGTADGCWLPAGHGRVALADAIAGSCNAYFRQLSQRTSPESFISTLHWFGMSASPGTVTPASMVGLGDGLELAPSAVLHAYLELVSRASQPGVSQILEGMRASARVGTGRGVGAAFQRPGALVKTGTAPCIHSPGASGDGYSVVVYPADRPRVALLVQAHGRTGAETASLAGELLIHALETR